MLSEFTLMKGGGMLDRRLLEEGLAIMVSSRERTGDLWHAHYGAGAIAAYFWVRENRLTSLAAGSVTAEAKAMLRQHGLKDGLTSLKGEAVPREEAEARITEALDRTIGELHWVGHQAIYGALSLKAIRELDGWGTQHDMEQMVELIDSFERTIPGRSWVNTTVKEIRSLKLSEADGFPDIERPDQLSRLILDELGAFGTIYQAEAHHDLIGHMLTYGHALNILYELDYPALFHKGIPPFLTMVKVLRLSRDVDIEQEMPTLQSPVDRLPLIRAERSVALPHELEYWLTDRRSRDWHGGHVFKFPFSFYHHARNGNSVPESWENFRYIIA
ncbi:hypothetical protein [Paenibacillus pabuli]|uniref:hypothetical protein n=1 Tax=Paenibacillus pabuli TaxID=1472 RepID=UPI001FFF012E|nr:hypothetical protein [Paenibacillus pabuli]